MSAGAENVEVLYDVAPLMNFAGKLGTDARSFQTEKLDLFSDTLMELAEQLQSTGAQHNDKVAHMRGLLKQVLGTNAEVEAHARALDAVALHVSPAMEPADFRSDLTARLETNLEESRYDPEQDDALRTFDRKVAAAAGTAAADLGEDEDFIIDEANADIAPNAACPISGKNVYDIEDPVEDVNGYVYEKAAIEQHIRRQGRGGIVACPVAMTSHEVSLATLKKAHHVVRAQKRKKRRDEQLTQHGAGPSQAVLDVY